MCASDGCGSFHDAQLSTCTHVNWALFPCHSEINLPYQNPKLFAKVLAQFAGLSLCRCEADEVSRSKLGGEVMRSLTLTRRGLLLQETRCFVNQAATRIRR